MSCVEVNGDVGAPVALVDLGDTLCDCRPALLAGLARLRRPGEGEADESLVPLPLHLEMRRREVMSVPGFWRELARRSSGFELLTLLREAGFRVHVVTKGPHDAPHVWADKVAWCRAHLPDVPVIITDDKARVHGHVLVDDWLPYVERWQRQWPEGLAILPAQPWNVHAALGSRRMRDEGNNRDAIIAALRSRRAAVAKGLRIAFRNRTVSSE
jgi:5'-nucleotidase